MSKSLKLEFNGISFWTCSHGMKWYRLFLMMKYNASKLALTEIILAYHLTLFGHIAQMDINVDAKQIPISSLL